MWTLEIRECEAFPITIDTGYVSEYKRSWEICWSLPSCHTKITVISHTTLQLCIFAFSFLFSFFFLSFFSCFPCLWVFCVLSTHRVIANVIQANWTLKMNDFSKISCVLYVFCLFFDLFTQQLLCWTLMCYVVLLVVCFIFVFDLTMDSNIGLLVIWHDLYIISRQWCHDSSRQMESY